MMVRRQVSIAPSILSACLLDLREEIVELESSGADRVHVDVMDGHFVPNLAFGPTFVAAIKRATRLPLDVHLMVSNTEKVLDGYIKAGADSITVHAESTVHLDRVIRQLRDNNIKAGVALNPGTHENAIAYVADIVDLVLVMSVNPGFGGQAFIARTPKKIAAVRAMLDAAGNSTCEISVDGGITAVTARPCVEAGAGVLVAGSYIYDSGHIQSTIAVLRASARPD